MEDTDITTENALHDIVNTVKSTRLIPISPNIIDNKKYGWSEKTAFEKYYKSQLIKLRKKISPLGCVSDLNNIETLEEISSKFDECIDNIGK